MVLLVAAVATEVAVPVALDGGRLGVAIFVWITIVDHGADAEAAARA